MYRLIKKLSQNKIIYVFLNFFIHLLPRRAVLALCQLVGGLLYSFGGDLSKKVTRNIFDVLYIKHNENFNEVKSISREYFVNLLVTYIEIQFYAKRLNNDISRFVQAVELENIDLALKEGKGVILYGSHLGNVFYYYYYISNFYPSLVVATALDKDLVNLYSTFHHMGCQGLDYDTTDKRDMLKKIKSHLSQNGVLVLLGDFWREKFPQSVMFDRTTRSPRGTAALALDHQIPVIYFYGYRTVGFQHKIVFQKPIYLHKIFERKQKPEATNFLNQLMENEIIKHPSQWFYWFNTDERWEKSG